MEDPIDPNSSGGTGNTISVPSKQVKQIAPAKRWCFTLNNYTEDEISSIVLVLTSECKLAIIGKEVGEEGTPHLQGYCEFRTKIRPKGLFTTRIHWEKCRGNREENVIYCRKEGDVCFTHGDIRAEPVTIKEEDFYEWEKELVEIFRKPCKWNCRAIYWRYGGVGIGKTQFAKWLCVHLNAVIIGGQHRHILAQVQNSYAPIYIVLLAYGDDEVSYRALEQIKDGLFSSHFGTDNNKMEIRNAPHLIVIGNEPPNEENRNFHPTKYNVKNI